MQAPSTHDSFLDLMAQPDTAAVIAARAPRYLQLIEQQVAPPPSAEVTLDDFVHIPETGVTAETLQAIRRDFSQLRPPTAEADAPRPSDGEPPRGL
jgi:hypothetical protein